jgi:ribosomal subunit interface protein
MEIKIKALGFTPRRILTDFIDKKLSKLFQFYDRLISIEVSLSMEKSEIKQNKQCDVRLIIPGNDLLASARCKTFEEAVVHSVEALIKQMEKKKNKHTGYEKAAIM